MNIKDKTIENLNAELKGIKIITGALIIVLTTLLIVCIYGLIAKEDNGVFRALIVVPLALSAIIPLNYGNMKKIKKEIASRK